MMCGMHRIYQTLIAAMTVLVISVSIVHAEGDHDATVKRDLFAVITLQGHPCGSVTNYQRLADNDYIAICATGHRYRINVTQEGRVAVKKHEPQGR